jgi:hypothetical protein
MDLPHPPCGCSGCAQKFKAAVTGLELSVRQLVVGHPAAEVARLALAKFAEQGVPSQFTAPGALGPALAYHGNVHTSTNLIRPGFGYINPAVGHITPILVGIAPGVDCINPVSGGITHGIGSSGLPFSPIRLFLGPAQVARTSGQKTRVDGHYARVAAGQVLSRPRHIQPPLPSAVPTLFVPGDRMLAASVVPAVYKTYSGAWDKWLAFALHHGVSPNPPDANVFKFYLTQEAELSASVSVVYRLTAAAALFTASANNKSPFDGTKGACLRRVLKGIRKMYAIPSVPKKPLTRDDIKSMLEVAAQPGASFALKRAVALTALCFQQMLRISEAIAIKGSDITFDSLKGAYIFKVRKAKNHSDGFSFTIPVDMGRTHCVGNYLHVYMAKIGLRVGDEHAHLACKASLDTGGRWCANIKGGISIDTARAGLKEAVRTIGLDPKLYSNSAKRGAATEAVKAGNTDAMVTHAGRWKNGFRICP